MFSALTHGPCGETRVPPSYLVNIVVLQEIGDRFYCMNSSIYSIKCAEIVAKESQRSVISVF